MSRLASFLIFVVLCQGVIASSSSWLQQKDHCKRVKGREPPLIYANRPWVHAGRKTTVSLVCQICTSSSSSSDQHMKDIQVWWSKDGRVLGQSSRVRQMVHHHTHYLLRIKNVRDKDLGVYYCGVNSTNGGGELARERIEVSGVPYAASFDLPSVWSESTFRLSWRVNCSTPIINYELEFREVPRGEWVALNVPGDGHRPTYAHNEQMIEGSNVGQGFNVRRRGKEATEADFLKEHTKSYTLRGLAKDTSYEARVRSRNIYGLSDESETLNFHTFDIPANTIESTSSKGRRHDAAAAAAAVFSIEDQKHNSLREEEDLDGNGIEDALEEELRRKATSQASFIELNQEDKAGSNGGVSASSEPLSTKERRKQGYTAFSSAIRKESVFCLILAAIMILQQ